MPSPFAPTDPAGCRPEGRLSRRTRDDEWEYMHPDDAEDLLNRDEEIIALGIEALQATRELERVYRDRLAELTGNARRQCDAPMDIKSALRDLEDAFGKEAFRRDSKHASAGA